jgi:hypothetical protein
MINFKWLANLMRMQKEWRNISKGDVSIGKMLEFANNMSKSCSPETLLPANIRNLNLTNWANQSAFMPSGSTGSNKNPLMSSMFLTAIPGLIMGLIGCFL